MEIKYKMIDLSYYNGTVDFNKVKQSGIDGVIIRAGYGLSDVDVKFHTYIKDAIKNKMHIGIYWFGYAHTVELAKKEANFCLKTIEPYKGNIDFPVFYDWEYDSYNYVKKYYNINADKTLVSNVTNAFCTEIEQAGWWAGFYANPDYLTNYYTDTVKNRFTLWVAQYSSKCSYVGQYGIWQYGADENYIDKTTSVNGVQSKNVDKDYCYIDYPALIKAKGLNGYSKSNITNNTPLGSINNQDIDNSKYPSWFGVKSFSYLKNGDTYVSPHFQVKEFASMSGNKRYSDDVLISYDLIQMLEKLYSKLKCTAIIINSGYRTASHDKAVGGSGTGQHVLGKASDIVCKNSNGIISSKIVCCVASDLGFGGVANISNRYQATHVDVRTGSIYRGDEIRGNSSIWKYNSKWTDFYHYVWNITKEDVAKYII